MPKSTRPPTCAAVVVRTETHAHRSHQGTMQHCNRRQTLRQTPEPRLYVLPACRKSYISRQVFSKFHDKFVHKSWQAVAFWVPGSGCAKNVSFSAGATRSQIDIVRAHTGGEASCLADHVRLKPLSTQQHVQRATVHSSAPFFVETIMVGKINRRNRPWQADPTLFARDAAEPTVR